MGIQAIKTWEGIELPRDACDLKDAANTMYGIYYCISTMATVADRNGRVVTYVRVTSYRRSFQEQEWFR